MTSIGKYQILEELGIGSMGTVYRARDSVLDREVALKTMRAGQYIDPEIKERFYREARACARLQHPHIVTIHDWGEVDDTAYISMELLVGEDLRKIIEAHREIPLRSQIEIIAQVSAALSLAHKNGVIHRDIKPSNIFVLADNSAKVLDFGVARLSESQLTVVGRVLGTPNYMAPEQIQGNTCDARSDLFSLAIVFFELLTGTHPFQSNAIPRRIVDGVPDKLCTVDPALPASIERFLDRALQKQPGNRFQSADEFSAVLRGVIDGLGGQYRTPEKERDSATSLGQEIARPPELGSQTQILESEDRRTSEFFRLMEECDRAMESKRLDAARQALKEMKQLAAIDARFLTAVQEYESRVMAIEGMNTGGRSASELLEGPRLPSTSQNIAKAPTGSGEKNRVAPSESRPIPAENPPAPSMNDPSSASPSRWDVTWLFSIPNVNAKATTTAQDSGSFENRDLRVTDSFDAPLIRERLTTCASCGAQNKTDSRFCTICGSELGGLSTAVVDAVPQIDEIHTPNASTPRDSAGESVEKALPTQAGASRVYVRLAVGLCLAGLITVGFLTVRLLKSRRVPLLAAVGAAYVTAESGEVLQRPNPGEHLLAQLRKGTRLNVVRMPQSPNPEWLTVQQIDGSRAMVPGYIRSAALGRWSTLQLAQLFDPGDSAELPRRIAYLQLLRSAAPEFKNPNDQTNVWLEIARQNVQAARQQKASSPSSDEWERYLGDARAALSKISTDPNVAPQSKLIEEQVVALLAPSPAAPATQLPVSAPLNPAPVPSKPRYDARADYRAAQDAYRLGDYTKATRLLERILAAGAMNPETQSLLQRVRKAAAEEAAASRARP
jgi:serine/threonine protein kinase